MGYLKEMSDQGYNVSSISNFHRVMLPNIFRSLGIYNNSKIVEIGAAHGHCAISLWEGGYQNIRIVDIDTYNFDYFKSAYGFECFQCDVSKEAIPFSSESIRVVLNAHLIEHLSTPEYFLSESFRIIEPGGIFILVTPDWRRQYKTFYRDPTHLRPYDKESIARLLRLSGFTRIQISSWGSAYGFGRLQAYRIYQRFGFIGRDLIAIGFKE